MKEIDLLKDIIDDASKTTIEFGKNNSKLTEAELGLRKVVCLDLIQKINSNFEGLYHLLDPFKEQPELKTPISLICRCLMSDTLAGYYLFNFEDEDTFNNELNIMGLDYIKYVSFCIDNTEVLNNSYFKNKSRIDILTQIKDQFPELIKNIDNLELKTYSRKELRKTSSEKYFPDEKDKNNGVNDSIKYELLNNEKDLKDILIVYHLLRHFSQYQHYCFENRYAITIEDKEILPYIIQSVYYSIHGLFSFSKLVENNDNYLSKLEELLLKFKDFKGAMIYHE